MTPAELSSAEAWFVAGLCTTRLGSTPQALERGLPWLRAALGENEALPPSGLILDVAAILDRRTEVPTDPAPYQPGDAELRRVVASCEEEVVARLSFDARVADLQDALSALPEARRGNAAGVFVQLLLQRLEFAGRRVPLAPLRRLLALPSSELWELGLAVLHEGGEGVAWLTSDYDGLVLAARRARALFAAPEIQVIERFDVLRSASQRYALMQLAAATETLLRSTPRRVAKRRHRDRGRATRLQAEDAYPVGGYTSLATLGSIENLVSSELMYMEQDQDLDLFDVRYASNELLRYLRDENELLREPRGFRFVFHPSLASTRVVSKARGLPFQRCLLGFALACGACQRLGEWLENAVIDARLLTLRTPGRDDPLAPERDLARLLLHDLEERGIVSTGAVDVEELSEDLQRADVDVVWITAREQAPEAQAPDGDVLEIDLSSDAPRLRRAGKEPKTELGFEGLFSELLSHLL